MGQYAETLTEQFHQADAADFGSATMTRGEWNSLREMHKEASKLFTTKDARRGWVLQEIEFHGWRKPRKLSEEEYAESAIKHACVVAESLLEEREDDDAYETYISYITKNQFDRFVEYQLRQNRNVDILEEWFSLDDRDPSHSGVGLAVNYPETIDNSKIYGISKPLRYLPAQLMKNIELLRLESQVNEIVYSIRWSEFDKVIEDASTLEEVGANIAIKVIEKYKARGIAPEKISEIILSGYKPSGPMKEHGDLESVKGLWRSLLIRLNNMRDHYAEIAESLYPKVVDIITEQGYKFALEEVTEVE